jgi:glycosyltransferase involved in cell wall biosynthesis
MQFNNPKVSVIIPTYNRRHLIQSTINSVLNQNYSDYELIVVDDASTDETVDFISDTRGSIPNLRLICLEENRGAAYARNQGIQSATGDFIAFLDSDDLWEPNFLEQMDSALESHQESVLAFSNASETDVSLTTTYFNFSPWQDYPIVTHRILLTLDIILTMSVVMVRRIALLQTGLLNENLKICHDKDLYLRLLRLGTFIHIPEILVKKISHDGNLVNQQLQLVEEDQKVIDLFFADPINDCYKSCEAEARSYILLRKAKLVKRLDRDYLQTFRLFMQACLWSPKYVYHQIKDKVRRQLK